MKILGFHPKKRLGQSFLIDKNIIVKMIKAANLMSEDITLEIGPGQGILTKELARNSKKVIAVELDNKLYQELRNALFEFDNVELINEDILEFDLRDFLKKTHIKNKIVLVANIPYSITSLILQYIFKHIDIFKNIYLMVQQEFAQRLTAQLNTKDYSSITCFAEFFCSVKKLFLIKRSCFRPQPKVDSYFINLEPKNKDYWAGGLKPRNKELLFKIIRLAFNQRRKNILNSFSSVVDKERFSSILSKLGRDWRLRAENLSIEDFIKISNLISE